MGRGILCNFESKRFQQCNLRTLLLAKLCSFLFRRGEWLCLKFRCVICPVVGQVWVPLWWKLLVCREDDRPYATPRLHRISAVGSWKSRLRIRFKSIRSVLRSNPHMTGISALTFPCVPTWNRHIYFHIRCVSPTFGARTATCCLPVKFWRDYAWPIKKEQLFLF